MNDIFELLVDLADERRAISYSPLNDGSIPGCDCGCGGDSYSDEDWDFYQDAEDSYQEILISLVNYTKIDLDEFNAAFDALDMIGEIPTEDEWEEDFEDAMETYLEYSKYSGPDIVNLMIKLKDLDMNKWDAENAYSDRSL